MQMFLHQHVDTDCSLAAAARSRHARAVYAAAAVDTGLVLGPHAIGPGAWGSESAPPRAFLIPRFQKPAPHSYELAHEAVPAAYVTAPLAVAVFTDSKSEPKNAA